MLFLGKDNALSLPVRKKRKRNEGKKLVEGLLKYWPFANSTKEMMFLTELLEVLDVCEPQKLEPLIVKLFKRLIKCIAGPHLQVKRVYTEKKEKKVADRAMCFFENEHFVNILKTFKSVTFPLVVPVIAQLADTHWHK